MTSPLLEPQDVYVDQRGRIITLPPFPAVESIVIESRAGAVRGNHYHRDERHLMYVLSGYMVYLEKDDEGRLSVVEVRAGEAVETPAGVSHCTLFPEDTVFLALSDVKRAGGAYEKAVVRVSPLHEHPAVREHVLKMPKLIVASPPAAEVG